MLVISRRIGESFIIGDNIEVTILDISGGKAVLGINAPKDVKIDRGEISGLLVTNRQAGASSGNINMKGFSKLIKNRYGR
ncbi:carbon storage regulator [Oscillospiraceae bacterium MB08-C2-2]|nr:carbon storage regulator [Oscillospiraceae bacterium MB08-C2-2]